MGRAPRSATEAASDFPFVSWILFIFSLIFFYSLCSGAYWVKDKRNCSNARYSAWIRDRLLCWILIPRHFDSSSPLFYFNRCPSFWCGLYKDFLRIIPLDNPATTTTHLLSLFRWISFFVPVFDEMSNDDDLRLLDDT